jgi:hypothetical protein
MLATVVGYERSKGTYTPDGGGKSYDYDNWKFYFVQDFADEFNPEQFGAKTFTFAAPFDRYTRATLPGVGEPVNVYFDERGKVALFQPVGPAASKPKTA